jgi:hypothetical protein
LVIVQGFVEAVGKVGVVEDGCNFVLIEHVVGVKIVFRENVITQLTCSGAVAKKV